MLAAYWDHNPPPHVHLSFFPGDAKNATATDKFMENGSHHDHVLVYMEVQR
jgi:hypothetical protein